MKNQITFDLYPDYNTLGVWNGDLDPVETYHAVNEQTVSQGFSSRLQKSTNFFTIGECTHLTVELFYANKEDDITVQDHAVRAILVPFTLNNFLKIGDLRSHVEVSVSSFPQNGVLLFEINLSVDKNHLNSLTHREQAAIGLTEECCRLTFYPKQEITEPSILRLDTEESLPYPIQGYTPFNPVVPLLTEVGRL